MGYHRRTRTIPNKTAKSYTVYLTSHRKAPGLWFKYGREVHWAYACFAPHSPPKPYPKFYQDRHRSFMSVHVKAWGHQWKATFQPTTYTWWWMIEDTLAPFQQNSCHTKKLQPLFYRDNTYFLFAHWNYFLHPMEVLVSHLSFPSPYCLGRGTALLT